MIHTRLGKCKEYQLVEINATLHGHVRDQFLEGQRFKYKTLTQFLKYNTNPNDRDIIF